MMRVIGKWLGIGLIVYAGCSMAWDLIAYAAIDRPIGDLSAYIIAAWVVISAARFALDAAMPESERDK